MRTLLLTLFLLFGWKLTWGADSEAKVTGKLFLIGGAERFDNHHLWDEYVRLIGGEGKTVAVIPAASFSPQRTAQEMVDQFAKLKLKAFIVPCGHRGFEKNPAEIAADPAWAERVAAADAVFFTGGEQAKIIAAMRNEDGSPTRLFQAVQTIFNRGGLVSGTSAGTAVMSAIMYRDAEFVLPTLVEGVKLGKEIDRGLGFLPAGWMVDQHCLMKGRFARTLVPMKMFQIPYGLGIEEDTALAIEGGVSAKVVGRSNVIFLDCSQAADDRQETRFNRQNIRLNLLGHGDVVDLTSGKITVSPTKLAGWKLDPRAPGHDFTYKHRPFYNDLLGPLAILDAMVKLIDNPHEEAFGLAFDGRLARQGATPGFEFHLTRDDKSIGWESEAFGPSDYTILNIRLDIRPITIQGPLFK